MNKITASDVMTRDVVVVAADLPINRLVDILVDNSISGAPVVSGDGKPIGIVSLSDLVRSHALGEAPAANGSSYYGQGLERLVAREDMASLGVGAESTTAARDIMTPMIFSVEEDIAVQEVADAMIRGRIHRVLVTRKGVMVGIISSLDLLCIVRDM